VSRGIIYYNTNTKCLHRLLTSIYSLRKVSNEPVAILSEGEVSHEFCYKIANCFDNVDVIETDYGVEKGKNKAYIEACLSHIYTPFETTVWADADTIVLKPFLDDISEFAEENEFAVARFSNWTSSGSQIARRIKAWEPYYPELIQDALNFGPAINCGVFAFHEGSEIMENWFELAERGRDNCFVADESCLQVWLHKFPHILVGTEFNRSCKYDDPTKEDTRVIHFHGRKHCRIGRNGDFIYGGDIWFGFFKEVWDENLAGVREWGSMGDSCLRSLFKTDKLK
jgi:hypothetical protein